MLLIIFLGLIAKLNSVCDACDIGTHGVENFDWTEVCIRVLPRFLKYRAVKTVAEFTFHL